MSDITERGQSEASKALRNMLITGPAHYGTDDVEMAHRHRLADIAEELKAMLLLAKADRCASLKDRLSKLIKEIEG